MIYDIIIFLSFTGMIACCILGALAKEKKVKQQKVEVVKVDFTN